MSEDELLTQVKAHIGSAVERGIANSELEPDTLFLFLSVQILEKLEAMHETLRSIESDVNATANMVASETGHVFLGKKDTP